MGNNKQSYPAPPLDQDVIDLLNARGLDGSDPFLARALMSFLKLETDPADRGDVKILSRSMREMRYAFSVLRRYRDVRKVSVFGSARTQPGHPCYAAARDLGRRMAENDWMVITGAGGGIMAAGHEGAGQDHSIGLAIRLPFEQSTNDVIEGDPKLIVFRHFFTRKLFFMKDAHALCLMPGGFGTHDEGFECLTLIQTGKAPTMPIVMLDQPGGDYWQRWREFVQAGLADHGYIGKEDFSLFKITDSVDEAVDEILGFYRRYHSSRYVDDDWIVRLSQPVDDSAVAALNERFGDILTGPIRRSGALEAEADEPALAAMPRLIVPFDRHGFARQRMLVDAINRA